MAPLTIGVLTCSDTRTEAEDTSGAALRALAEDRGWSVAAATSARAGAMTGAGIMTSSLGRWIENVEPLPSSDWTVTSPSCALMISLQIARPKPVPPILRRSELSMR